MLQTVSDAITVIPSQTPFMRPVVGTADAPRFARHVISSEQIVSGSFSDEDISYSTIKTRRWNM